MCIFCYILVNRQTKNASGNSNGNGMRPAFGSTMVAADVAATNDAACWTMVVADAEGLQALGTLLLCWIAFGTMLMCWIPYGTMYSVCNVQVFC